MATMRCLNALGAKITYSSGVFEVTPVSVVKGGTLDCGESGATLRFLVSVAAALGADATFVAVANCLNVLWEHCSMLLHRTVWLLLATQAMSCLSPAKVLLPVVNTACRATSRRSISQVCFLLCHWQAKIVKLR
jgi:hypothetical protein